MRNTLEYFFQKLNHAQIPYCLLRDADQLERITPKMEIDLLVDPACLPILHNITSELGFIYLDDWGYNPHHFFLLYDESNDFWLKLDVVTQISFGYPIPTYQTSFSEKILKNRKSSGYFYTPSPEDELITLLLHCLLDKGVFTPARRQRIRLLLDQVSSDYYFKRKITSFFSDPQNWTRIENLIRKENWAELLEDRKTISTYFTISNGFSAAFDGLELFILRKLNRIRRFFHPVAPSITLLAPDGAGKSTLAQLLKDSSYFPAATIYMGLYPIQQKASKEINLPGLNLIARLFKIWNNYLLARYKQAQGHLIIFDRYVYDALLPSKRSLTLRIRITRWLISHSVPSPDLVTILDAPGEVLFTRKGQHTPEILESQRQAYKTIMEKIPNAIMVDATQPLEVIQQSITSLLWRLIKGKQAGYNFSQVIMEWGDKSRFISNKYPTTSSVESRVEILR